jgi:hypothetical protein
MKHSNFKNFFTKAPWPSVKESPSTLVTYIIVGAALAASIVLSLVIPGFPVWRRVMAVVLLVIFAVLLPWILYFFTHAFLSATEGVMIAVYKIRDAWKDGKAPAQAMEDFFVARRLYETTGPIKGPRKAYMSNTKESLQNGLCSFMKDSRILRTNMPEGAIESLAVKLTELKLDDINADTKKPVTKEKLQKIGCYELLTVIMDLMWFDVSVKIQQKELAQWICKWFPAKYPNTVSMITYLSRLGNRIYRNYELEKEDEDAYDYEVEQKSTETEVPLLSWNEMKDAVGYFCDYTRKTTT